VPFISGRFIFPPHLFTKGENKAMPFNFTEPILRYLKSQMK
jgi:hypothetical protein